MRFFKQSASAYRNLGFFAIALVVHGALLMLPINLRQPQDPASERLNQGLDKLLSVQLLSVPKPPSDAVEPAAEVQAPVEDLVLPDPAQRKPAAHYTLVEIPPPADVLAPDDHQVSDTAHSLPLSTQQLRHWLKQVDGLAAPQKAGRTLGAARSYLPPANWNRHAGAAFLASFDDRSHEVSPLPEVTVVDRWQAGDGSHQVLVQLPDGESLCGRAEAYNPMQPLVEHIMMFRSCGRTPTFTMPERFNKDR